MMSDKNEKSAFDEQALARVLEAAYVLQEHRREPRKAEPADRTAPRKTETTPPQSMPVSAPVSAFSAASSLPAASQPPKNSAPAIPETLRLGQIVEAQRQMQARNLDLESALALVAGCALEITHASGASLAILEGNRVRYRAASGSSVLPRGTEIARETALCFSCLRSGEVMRCDDANAELLVDAAECRRRGIAALIVAPVLREGSVAGALEIYFDQAKSIAEQDVHACQLLAGLAAEALVREAQLASRKSIEAERASMLEALEKLQPNLAALVEAPTSREKQPRGQDADAEIEKDKSASASFPDARSEVVCRKCGHGLLTAEQFCGKCGTARSTDYEPPNMQSKVATLWLMQQAGKHNAAAAASDGGSARVEARAAQAPAAPRLNIVDEASSAPPNSNLLASGMKIVKRDAGRDGNDVSRNNDVRGNNDAHGNQDRAAAASLSSAPANEAARTDLSPGLSSSVSQDALQDEALPDLFEMPEIKRALAALEEAELPAISPAGPRLDPSRFDLPRLDSPHVDPSHVDPLRDPLHVEDVSQNPFHDPRMQTANALDPHVADAHTVDLEARLAAQEDELARELAAEKQTAEQEEHSGADTNADKNSEIGNSNELPAVTTPAALVKPDATAAWTSAAQARDFLEKLAASSRQSGFARFWNARRGDVYLAIAVILVGAVIRWGIWSSHSSATAAANAASHHKQADPTADLSMFDRLLVSLGLAEAPSETPEFKGNPDAQVWVDTHTALYYCAGADLYGKTPQGKVTTQRDAQLDRFEPALHRACE